jgi:hypothetical protein
MGWAIAVFAIGVAVYIYGGTLGNTLWKELLTSLGGVVASVIAVTFLMEIIFGDDRYDQLVANVLNEEAVLAKIQRTVTDGLVPGAQAHGLVGIDEAVDFKGLFSDLREGDELLWLATYIETDFDDVLSAALDRHATVRMLVIDPESSCLSMRADELSEYYSAHYRVQTEAFLDRLRRREKQATEDYKAVRLEVRTYDDLPNASVFIVRRGGKPFEARTGFYIGQPIVRTPHLQWREGNMLGYFNEYFEEKWKRATSRASVTGAIAES